MPLAYYLTDVSQDRIGNFVSEGRPGSKNTGDWSSHPGVWRRQESSTTKRLYPARHSRLKEFRAGVLRLREGNK